MKKLLSFGCGNMAGAIIKGMKANSCDLSYTLFTPSKTRAQALAKDVEGEVLEDLSKIPKADYYMISCKPQQLEELSKSIKGKLSKDSVIISILAGTTVSRLKEALGVEKVLRVMPNTPTLVGAGVNAFHFSSEVSKNERDELVSIFSSFSRVFDFEKEEEIDIITGFSGSGPAYIFEFSRLLTEKMISMGIDKEVATEMIKWTVFGSSKLQVESSESSETLRNNVTSKNGVTYEALEKFKELNLENMIDQALNCAYNRSIELSKES
jgi:pyrroline-5-carboxylate reductase